MKVIRARHVFFILGLINVSSIYASEDATAEDLFLREESIFLSQQQIHAEISLSYEMDTVGDSGIQSVDNRFVSEVTLRYGATKRLEYFVSMPIILAYNTISQDTVLLDKASSSGIGNSLIGLKWKVSDEALSKPNTIFTLTAQIPSLTTYQPSIGDDAWSYTASIIFIKTLSPTVFYLELGGSHFEDNNYKNSNALFQSLNYRFGVGLTFTDQVVFNSQLIGSYRKSALVENVMKSASHPILFRLSSTIQTSKEHYIEPFFSYGLTPDVDHLSFGVAFPINF